MAITASIPKTPIAFFNTDAPASTDEAASDIMLPTTGNTVDRAVFATRIVAASAVEDTIPVTLIYTTNDSTSSVSIVVASHLRKPEAPESP